NLYRYATNSPPDYTDPQGTVGEVPQVISVTRDGGTPADQKLKENKGIPVPGGTGDLHVWKDCEMVGVRTKQDQTSEVIRVKHQIELEFKATVPIPECHWFQFVTNRDYDSDGKEIQGNFKADLGTQRFLRETGTEYPDAPYPNAYYDQGGA